MRVLKIRATSYFLQTLRRNIEDLESTIIPCCLISYLYIDVRTMYILSEMLRAEHSVKMNAMLYNIMQICEDRSNTLQMI